MNSKLGLTIPRRLKTTALSLLIQAYTGEKPDIIETPDFDEINFTTAQAKLLQDQLAKWETAEPGDVRINVKPVLMPYYMQKYAPYFLLTGIGGILLGLFLSRRRR